MTSSLEAGYYGSPRWSGEICDCSMPVTFDQYSVCSYNCFYCFSAFQRGIGGSKEAYCAKRVRAVNVERVKRIFTDPDSSQFSWFIKNRKPIQWGGLSDPFDEFEKRFRIGLELLQFFASIRYPICFSTKGTWWTLDPEYISLFQSQKQWNVKVSIITRDNEKAQVAEPGVPSSSDRLDAIRRIASWDCGGATLRLRPFVIGLSNPGHLQLIREAAQAGASAVSLEFLCMEQRSEILRKKLPEINRLIGYDLLEFYKQNSRVRGYLRLCREVKRPFVDEMEATCRETGMRFYVSDAHFKERSCNGSCCGLPSSWNYSKGQWTVALLMAKRSGRVQWRDWAGYLEYARALPFAGKGKATGFNIGAAESYSKFIGKTMYDWIQWHWNHPNSQKSPYRYFEGILTPEPSLDEEGNVVYRYNKDKE